MKKTLTILCIVVMVATLGLSLFACKGNEDFGNVAISTFLPAESTMGTTKPTQTPKVAITKESTPEEILYAINQNFLNANNVITYLRGNVHTTLPLLMNLPVDQIVIGNKVRIGKADASDVEFWADNRSYSGAAAVYDETYMSSSKNIYKYLGKGEIGYSKSADKKYAKANNEYIQIVPTFVNNGVKVEPDDVFYHSLNPAVWDLDAFHVQNFDTQAALVKKTVNDPRRIWMYDTYQEDGTVTPGAFAEVSPVEQVEGKDQYKFSIKFDKDKVTTNYIEVLKYMLTQGAGEVKDVNFVGLKFDIVVWDNGYISDLYINEQYSMKVAGIIESNVVLTSRQQYSYDVADTSADVKFLMDKYNAAKAW